MRHHRDLSRRAEACLIHGRPGPRSRAARDHAQRVQATLGFLHAPLVLRQLCLLLFSIPGDFLEPVFDMVELFAGDHAITKALWSAGRLCIPFDVLHDSVLYDILGDIGFIHALLLVLSLRVGSLRAHAHTLSCVLSIMTCMGMDMQTGGCCWMAPVCSSWTFMNKATSGRHISKPLGRCGLHDYVHEANVMVSRCTLLAWAALAAGAFYCLEQPAGSLLQFHPRWQELIVATKVHRTTCQQC
jgi:hypothetical protein